MRRMITVASATAVLAATAGAALASETITYTYDAKGRLVKVEHAGSVNNGLMSNYTFDKTDNRATMNITGA